MKRLAAPPFRGAARPDAAPPLYYFPWFRVNTFQAAGRRGALPGLRPILMGKCQEETGQGLRPRRRECQPIRSRCL